jgi:hypothetical protein
VEQIGRFLVVAGLVVAVLGALMWSGAFRNLPFGRLPGDLSYRKDGFSVFVPLGSMLVISLVLTLISWLANALKR